MSIKSHSPLAFDYWTSAFPQKPLSGSRASATLKLKDPIKPQTTIKPSQSVDDVRQPIDNIDKKSQMPKIAFELIKKQSQESLRSPLDYGSPTTSKLQDLLNQRDAQIKEQTEKIYKLELLIKSIDENSEKLKYQINDLQAKNKILLEEIDMLSQQRDALLNETIAPSKNPDLEALLSTKVKHYRVQLKLFENEILEAETKRLALVDSYQLQLALEREKASESQRKATIDFEQLMQKTRSQHQLELKSLDNRHLQEKDHLQKHLTSQIEELKKQLETVRKEKEPLLLLISSQREELSAAEEARTQAINERSLIKEKLQQVSDDKKITDQRVKNLEGMYKAELGEVKNAEILLSDLKKKELEMEYCIKVQTSLLKERNDLKQIIEGLKEEIAKIEQQRDHFEKELDAAANKNSELQDALGLMDEQKLTWQAGESELTDLRTANKQMSEDIKSYETRLHQLIDLKNKSDKDLLSQLEVRCSNKRTLRSNCKNREFHGKSCR